MGIVFDHVTKKIGRNLDENFFFDQNENTDEYSIWGKSVELVEYEEFYRSYQKEASCMTVLRRYCMEFSEEREIR